MTLVLVLLGGAIGAPARYLADRFVQSRHQGAFPWGTFTVNVLGSLILGVTAATVVAAAAPTWVLALVGTGFCGALTTFSAFGFETVRLIEQGAWLTAALYSVASLGAGLAGCAGGFAAVSAIL